MREGEGEGDSAAKRRRETSEGCRVGRGGRMEGGGGRVLNSERVLLRQLASSNFAGSGLGRRFCVYSWHSVVMMLLAVSISFTNIDIILKIVLHFAQCN